MELSRIQLSRIQFIRESTLEDLQNPKYIEELMMRLGFNNESLIEQPSIVHNNIGGLLIWQYPNQFSKYLCLLQKQSISSYLEIGCRWGGTFVLTTEYLSRFNELNKSVAIDIIDSPVQTYCEFSPKTEFIKMNSTSNEFKRYIENNSFDCIFIDGDHSYEGVKNDYMATKDKARIFVFHDIENDMCPGVVQFWNELKNTEKDTFDFYEFTDQYEDVWNRTQLQFLGIGVAIKKV